MGIGTLLSKYYFEQTSGDQYQITKSIEKTSADILILGSSTASHDYNPSIIEKDLKMTCYNAGVLGSSIFYDFAVLKAVTNRYKPKIIILNFDAEEFKTEQIYYDRLSNLLPYYANHPEIRSIVVLKSPFEKYKLISKIYPYNSLVIKILSGNYNISNGDSITSKGYQPLFKEWKDKIQTCDSSFINYDLDPNKIKFFEAFIQECAKKKIPLYIVSCPLFCTNNYTSPAKLIGKKIAEKYNIKFFDYSNDPEFLSNPSFFADTKEHLNDNGCRAFSEKICRILQ